MFSPILPKPCIRLNLTNLNWINFIKDKKNHSLTDPSSEIIYCIYVIYYLYLVESILMKDTYYIFRTLFYIVQRWQNIMDRELIGKAGLTTRQWMLMVLLSRLLRDRLPTISETAIAFGTSRQNLRRIACDLQKKGYLIIVPDPSDKRVQRLALTGKHAEVFEGQDNLKWQEDAIRNLFVGLDENEQARLSKSLYRLQKRIEQIE